LQFVNIPDEIDHEFALKRFRNQMPSRQHPRQGEKQCDRCGQKFKDREWLPMRGGRPREATGAGESTGQWRKSGESMASL
jgi:hypothetical protein